jgi:uncharacterized protein YidB (DUF937 family)
MGLLDILNGMQNGPRGQPQPGTSSSGGGMSPITMALLGLLAYKALQGSGGLGNILGGGQQPAPAGGAGRPAPLSPGGSVDADIPSRGGGLGDILGGLFGGGPGGAKPGAGLSDLIPRGLGGGAAGSVLSGGIGKLIKDLQSSGQGEVAKSWVGTGPNKEIAPEGLEAAVGKDTLDALIKQTGMKREDLLAALSQHLPAFIDKLTPNGRLPTEKETAQLV